MTTHHTSNLRSFALAAAAMLLFTSVLAAQRTAQEPQVVFRVQMVQAEQAGADKVAAERMTESKADFNRTNMIGVHILKDTTDATSLVAGEASRNTLELLSTPVLTTLNGEEARYLIGARKPVPTVEDLLSTEEKSEPAPDELELNERDFGLKLDLRPVILPNGRIRVRVRPQVTSADFSNATLHGERYIPAIATRQMDATYDVKPGQTIVLTGLFDDATAQQLTRSSGVADEGLLKQLLDTREANQ